MTKQDIAAYVLNYIKSQYGNAVSAIDSSTKLVTSRLLDSINTLHMVSHLEEHFKFDAEAHEVNTDNFDTVESIANYVASKIGLN